MSKSKNKKKEEKKDIQLNEQLEGNDKAPGEESGKGEKVTNNDLKSKEIDPDPTEEQDRSA